MSGIAGVLAALDAMASAALHARWIALTNSPVPRVSPNLLRLALAWEIQANAGAGSARTAGRCSTNSPAAPHRRSHPGRCG